jgi:predicted TPR repeat methyltransferase
LGCVDEGFTEEGLRRGNFLHSRLLAVTESLWGVDISERGIKTLQGIGIPNLIVGDVEKLNTLTSLQNEKFDIILAGEILEHLNNPGLFLQSVKSLFFPETKMIITVPNSFRLNQFWYSLFGYEAVNPDHNYWFSQKTLSTLLEKNGYIIDEISVYQYSYSRPTLKKILNLLVNSPFYRLNCFFTDGLSFITRPKDLVKR